MPDREASTRASTKGRTVRLALLGVAVLASLPGCNSVDDWLRGRQVAEPREDIVLGAPPSSAYLEELRALVAGDPYTQVEIFADAESAATLTPNPSTQLRFALILGTPGHASADPERAASLLRELLAETELLTGTEIALATIYLRNVDQQLVTAAESRRLQSEHSTAQSAEQRATARRIADVEAENERLRRQLADVEQKLEALTSIERSIRAQEEDNGT